MHYRSLFVYLLLFPVLAFCQQDPTISNLTSSQVLFNPAVAGSDNGISGNLVSRNQWNKLENMPEVYAASFHLPVNYKRIGIGLQFERESYLIQKFTSVNFIYSYKINFASGILSMGLGSGVKIFSINPSQLRIKDLDDKFLTQQDYSSVSFDLSAGLFYKSKKWRIGLSSTHLQKNKLLIGKYPSLVQPRHFYFFADYTISLSEELLLQPASLLRYVTGVPPQLDAGISTELKKLITAGIFYRTNKVLNFMAGINLYSEFATFSSFKINYSYDMSLSQKGIYNSDVHELTLACLLKQDKSKRNIRKQRVTENPLFF